MKDLDIKTAWRSGRCPWQRTPSQLATPPSGRPKGLDSGSSFGSGAASDGLASLAEKKAGVIALGANRMKEQIPGKEEGRRNSEDEQ